MTQLRNLQLINALGSAIGQDFANPLFTLTPSDGLAIAKGLMPGASSFCATGRMSGVSANTVGDDIWASAAPTIPYPPTAGEKITISSTNSNDRVGGTGVQTVEVEYLDPSGNTFFETINLNGTTKITLAAAAVMFIQDAHATSAGSNGLALGNITIQSLNTPANVYAIIAAGTANSNNSMRMVPAGKTLYITGWNIGNGTNSDLTFSLRTTSYEGTLIPSVFQEINYIESRTGPTYIPF